MQKKLAGVLAAAALSLTIHGCSTAADPSQKKDAAKRDEATIPVEIAQPARKELLATYSGTATLEAEADADVIAKVQGEVQRLLVEEGDAVRAGQVLAVLDGRQLRLEVAQASAELAKLERDYRRQIELNERGLVAAGTFEGMRYDLDTLRAKHDLAELQLSYTEIRAPFAGLVARRNVRLGQTVQPNAVLFRVTDPTPLKAQVFIPERELKRLQAGQAAAVQVDAVPGKRFLARVSLVSPTIDTQTATFKATVEVTDPSGELRPGMFARIGIVFERKPEALQIPRVALVETDGERSVFVVQDGVAHQRSVETGLADSGNVEIVDGLVGNEQVVIVGQSGLKDGNKVHVVTLQTAVAKQIRSCAHSRENVMQLVDFAIRRRVTIAMATIAISLLGAISLSRLKVNLLPDLSYPTLTIRTELPGAAPLEVENLLSRPIEEAAGVIRNVRTVRSISRSGQSDVVLEFLWGTDMDFSGIEVRERLDLLQLPLEATRPLLLRFDPSTEPVMRLALVDTAKKSANGTSETRLKYLRRFADDRLKPEIESIEGSAAVKVSGGFEDEIHIYVDQQRLAQLGLSIQHVAQRIGAENVNLSGGRLEQGTQRFLVRTVNEFESLDDMAGSVIATVGGQPVYLKDVARLDRGYKDRAAVTRLNGRECIELAVYEEGDANTVQLAGSVHQRLETLNKMLPPDTQLVAVYDQAEFISSAIGDVRDAALWGGLLSVLVLYFFLRDARATVVTGIVIPVTVIGIFVLMYAFDLTLNIMSLGGIALSVGMLVDNSVVILEAVARKREAGLSALDAAREGTREVAMAVTASTLTSVAVFFPMVFVSGIAGQLFRDQALTVTFAQLLSLLVGLTLVPMLAARRSRAEVVAPERAVSLISGPAPTVRGRASEFLATLHAAGRQLRVGENVRFSRATQGGRARLFLPALSFTLRWLGFFFVRLLRYLADVFSKLLALVLAPFVSITQMSFGVLERRYPAVLDWALNHRATVLSGACAALALTVVMLPRLGTELIPQLAQGEFSVKLRLAAGTPLESTDQAMRAAQVAANALPDLDRAYSVAGTGNRLDANPVDSGENTGTLDVSLKPPGGPLAEERAMQSLRERISNLPGVQYEFSRPALLTLTTPVEVILYGYDLERLSSAASSLRTRMEASGAFRDVRSTIEGGHPEIQILFDQERASQLGLTVRDIADRVVSNVRGDVATRYRWQDKKIDVLVRSVDTRSSSVEDVRNLIVNPGAVRTVPLSAVADVRLAVGPAEIRRANQERVAVISAAPSGDDLGAATQTARELLAAAPLPAGIAGSVSGQSEEMQQSFRSLMLAFALAVFLVYLVMASQFESLLHPLVILFTIPMGLIGAVWGLFVTGATLNAVALIGLIMLAGIVVNNAIVLIDAINQARERGLEKLAAIAEAGRTRLRPILITSVSTVLGLLPMAIGLGEGAEIRRPMAITVIGGIIVATFLTLVIIPVLYAALDRKTYVRVEHAAPEPA